MNEEIISLNDEQKEVLRIAFCGPRRRNIFYTGSGGVGKTTVTRAVQHFLKRVFGGLESKFAITASTGIAATHLHGCTIHSAAGIGVPMYVSDFRKAWGQKVFWRSLEVLVIDEISMISGEFLDYLSNQVAEIRDPRPANVKKEEGEISAPGYYAFGGIQLLFCGDFFQLPPIATTRRSDENLSTNTDYCRVYNRGYAFESLTWHAADIVFHELTHVMRQKDEKFVTLLNRFRTGRHTSSDLAVLNNCAQDENKISKSGFCSARDFIDKANAAILKSKDLIDGRFDPTTADIKNDLCVKPPEANVNDPICLFPVNSQVDRLNLNMLDALDSDLIHIVAFDYVRTFESNMENYKTEQYLKG